MVKIEELLIKNLLERKLTFALAESITCGNATSRLSTVKDLGKAFVGSVVTYTPDAKNQMLSVSEKLMCDYTCESPEVTCEMAEGLSRILDADIHVAVTGLAAPGGSETEEKPVGTVFYCLKYKGKLTHVRKFFNGDPPEIMEQSCEMLYELIINLIGQDEKNSNLAG